MKILTFVGREHHYLKLNHLFSTNKSIKNKWFYADNSINIDPTSAFISHIPGAVHVYDYLTEPVNVSLLDLGLVESGVLENIPPFWAVQGLRELMTFVMAFDAFLAAESPDGVVVLHENNFWTKYISWKCRESGIPVFVFQEGLLRDLDQDTLGKQSSACEFATKMFVWSDLDREKYISAGVPEDKICVSGITHLRRLTPKQIRTHRNKVTNKPIIMYAIPLQEQYRGDLEQDLSMLQEWATSNNRTLVLRTHPFEYTLATNLRSLGFIVNNNDVSVAIQMADAVLTQHSTIGVESAALGVPTYEFVVNGVIDQPLPLPKIHNYSELDTLLIPTIPEETELWVTAQLNVATVTTIHNEINKAIKHDI